MCDPRAAVSHKNKTVLRDRKFHLRREVFTLAARFAHYLKGGGGEIGEEPEKGFRFGEMLF